jgi:microcystin-dependent protein
VQAAEIRTGHLVHVLYDPTSDTFLLLSAPPNGLAVPIGTWLTGGWDTLPPGCLWPDGRNVSRTTYAALFAVYSTRWGAGDGSTTFGLPDLRGRAVFGRDDMGGSAASRITSGNSGIAGATLGAAGGSELLHTHNHSVTDPQHAHTGYTDNPGDHSHGLPGNVITSAVGFAGGASYGYAGSNTYGAGNHTHGVQTYNAATGISIQILGFCEPAIVKAKFPGL